MADDNEDDFTSMTIGRISRILGITVDQAMDRLRGSVRSALLPSRQKPATKRRDAVLGAIKPGEEVGAPELSRRVGMPRHEVASCLIHALSRGLVVRPYRGVYKLPPEVPTGETQP